MAGERSAAKDEGRRTRLAKALRDNLKRRKTQARSRAETDAPAAHESKEPAAADPGAKDRDL